MPFKYLLKVTLILLTLSSTASAQTADTPDQAALAKYSLLRKNITETKTATWSLLKEIRDLGRIEKWSGKQQTQELQEAETILRSLPQLKSFKLYNITDLENDLTNLAATNQKIITIRKNIADRNDVHQQIQQTIKLCKKDAAIAYNKTKQLLVIRKNIQSFYQTKFGAQYPPANVGAIANILKTAQLLSDISKMNFAVMNFEKAEAAGFSKISEEIYNPQNLLQNLRDIDETLTTITQQSLEDIKNDNITMQAVQMSFLTAIIFAAAA